MSPSEYGRLWVVLPHAGPLSMIYHIPHVHVWRPNYYTRTTICTSLLRTGVVLPLERHGPATIDNVPKPCTHAKLLSFQADVAISGRL